MRWLLMDMCAHTYINIYIDIYTYLHCILCHCSTNAVQSQLINQKQKDSEEASQITHTTCCANKWIASDHMLC